MNPNPNAYRILCYGDSNTKGTNGKDHSRYSSDIRWTGLLQTKLGNDYEIIEEGLGGRTSNMEEIGGDKRVGRNGLTYFMPCIESHNPLDLIILFLGTNDLKVYYHRNIKHVTRGIEELLTAAKQLSLDRNQKPTRLLLVSPPLILDHNLKQDSNFKNRQSASVQLAPAYEELAAQHNCLFIDLSQSVEPGKDDGIHLDLEGHRVVAELMYTKIMEIR